MRCFLCGRDVDAADHRHLEVVLERALLIAKVEVLETRLADAWYSFEPAYDGADPEAGMDSADWWALMGETREQLQPKGD